MTLSVDNQVVQGFWSGPLTTMERLSMASFLANGHQFHLYTYDDYVKGVPEGVLVLDAAKILPESEQATFRCSQQFSDWFRIKLLLDKGGWHSDLDNVALKPLDISSEYVFYSDHDESTVSLALAKAPAGAPLLQHCHAYIASLSADDRARLSWQEIGAEFVQGAVEYFHMTNYAQPGRAFDPIHHLRIRELVNPEATWDLENSYSLHLFHAAWNQGPADRTGRGFDLDLPPGPTLLTDATYHPDSLYEKLKALYL